MRNQLVSVINRLKAGRLASFDDCEVKHVVVLPLLSILGWDISNSDEAYQHDKPCGRAEYSLMVNGITKVFIEAMKKGERLKSYEKYRNYFLREKDGFVILTNGVTWWFYFSPLHDMVKWEEELFYVIDILHQKSDDIASRFIDFLSKQNVMSGNALINAEKGLYEKMRLCPKRWNQIIENIENGVNEYAGKSLAHIKRNTERVSGFKTDAWIVERFLREHKGNFRISEPSAREEDFSLTTVSPAFKKN